MGRNKTLPILEQVTITDVAAEGNAIAKVNSMVVFVPLCIPGDVVDIQVVRKRKSYMEGRVIKTHQLSPLRIQPVCEHFGVCGGCKWQSLPYPEQLKYKQKQVTDALNRIGKVTIPEQFEILGSQKTFEYRNKLEYTFSSHRWLSRAEMENPITETNALGFHIPKLFDKILDINHCHLQPEPSNRIRLWLKKFTTENQYSYYSNRAHEGLMRNVIIRTSDHNQVMVIVVFGQNDEPRINQLLSEMNKAFGSEISSLMYVVNTKLNDTISDLPVHCYNGNDHITAQMEHLTFKIGPKSFYQTNSDQAHELYKATRLMADIKGDELVYDLYTGTGTIALFVANQAKKVIGIEYVADAIVDAKHNAEFNNITNTDFFAGDMKDILNEQFIASHGKPDVIITDPPRAGMHTDVINTILLCEPKRIVYVSCNPATQARDIELLSSKYKVAKVQPVDMFPHTHHVENIVLLVIYDNNH